jgi:hypothetical protein
MDNQEMISVLRNYLSRLKSGKGDIHPKSLREEMRRTRDDIYSLREDILSKNNKKNKSYATSIKKTYARGGK